MSFFIFYWPLKDYMRFAIYIKLASCHLFGISNNKNVRLDAVLGSTAKRDKKISYCWETVRRESMPRIAEIDLEMTT